MPYQGHQEFICQKGHYFVGDQHAEPSQCEEEGCEALIQYRHEVDTTNGYDETYADTSNAPKREIAKEDRWLKDHYGNKYAVMVLRYAPASKEWINVEMERAHKAELKRLNEESQRHVIQFTTRDRREAKYLNEYDPTTHEFTLTESTHPRHWHMFREFDEAAQALAHISAAFKSNEVWKDYRGANAQIFTADIRQV